MNDRMWQQAMGKGVFVNVLAFAVEPKAADTENEMAVSTGLCLAQYFIAAEQGEAEKTFFLQ